MTPYRQRTPRQIGILISVRLREIVALCAQTPHQSLYDLPDLFEPTPRAIAALPARADGDLRISGSGGVLAHGSDRRAGAHDAADNEFRKREEIFREARHVD